MMKAVGRNGGNLGYGDGVSSPTQSDGVQDPFPLLEVFQEPGNDASQLVLSALRTAALLDRVVARALGPFNLHHAQFNALILLKREREKGLRPSVLGDYLCVSRPNVTKLLARLKSRSLIEEKPDAADGRAVLAVITDDGVNLADQAFSAMKTELTAAVATLPGEDGATLRVLLDRFRDGLSHALRASGCVAEAQSTGY